MEQKNWDFCLDFCSFHIFWDNWIFMFFSVTFGNEPNFLCSSPWVRVTNRNFLEYCTICCKDRQGVSLELFLWRVEHSYYCTHVHNDWQLVGISPGLWPWVLILLGTVVTRVRTCHLKIISMILNPLGYAILFFPICRLYHGHKHDFPSILAWIKVTNRENVKFVAILPKCEMK